MMQSSLHSQRWNITFSQLASKFRHLNCSAIFKNTFKYIKSYTFLQPHQVATTFGYKQAHIHIFTSSRRLSLCIFHMHQGHYIWTLIPSNFTLFFCIIVLYKGLLCIFNTVHFLLIITLYTPKPNTAIYGGSWCCHNLPQIIYKCTSLSMNKIKSKL